MKISIKRCFAVSWFINCSIVKELEEIEEKWKQETLKLIGMVNKLKEENKRLNDSLDQNQNLNSNQNDQFGTSLIQINDGFQIRFL